jgi:hypothetical protein
MVFPAFLTAGCFERLESQNKATKHAPAPPQLRLRRKSSISQRLEPVINFKTAATGAEFYGSEG